MPVKGPAGAGGRTKVRRRRKPASQGHPSQGRPTVGGGTKSKPIRYRSPTPSVREQRNGPKPASPGHPSRGRPTVSGGTKKHPKVGRYKTKTPSIRKQRAEAAKRRSMLKARRALSQVGKGIHKKDGDSHIRLGPVDINIEAELEGRGIVSKYAEKAKKVATSDVGRSALRAGGLPSTGSEKIDKNLAKDIVDLPTQTIPSTYAIGAGAYEAARGRPKRIKQVGKQLKEHDPIVLAAQGKFKKAAKEAEKHPGLTALEAYGVGSAVSRTAGVGARAGGKVVPGRAGKTLRKAGNTKRAPKVAPGTEMREHREWSRGLGAKAVQVINEERKIRKARKLRQQAKKARSTHEKDRLNQRAAQADPRVMSNSEIKRRSAEYEDLAEHRRRIQTKEAKKAARVITGKKGPSIRLRRRVLKDKHESVALLIAQNIVKPTRESLLAYKKQIDAARSGLSRAELKTNRTLSNQIGALLKQDKIDFDDLVARAEAFKEQVRPRQEGLVARGIITPEEARMSPLVPYAVQEMEAKWTPAQKKYQPGKPEGDGWARHTDKNGQTYWTRPGRLERGRTVETEKQAPRTSQSREEFIASRPKARRDATPTVEGLAKELTNKRGKPGITRETEHGDKGSFLWDLDRHRESQGLPPTTYSYVHRSKSGEPVGILKVLLDPDGKPSIMEIAVDPALQGKGIGKGLVARAAKDFTPEELEAAFREGGLTEAGAGLSHSLLSSNPKVAKASRTEQVAVLAEDIERHMSERGVDPPVYVTQAPNQRGARNYYSSYHEPKGVSRKSRTGEATRKGTFEVNRFVAEEGLSRAENLISAHDNYGDWIGENMFRGRRGRDNAEDHFYDTIDEARNAIANELYDSPYEWEVVSTRPMFGRKGQSESLADRADMRDPATDVDIHEGVASALDGNGAGKFAIVPKAAKMELRAHAQQSSMKALRAWKNLNRQFSGTVLTTSGFTWPLGNVGEGVLRLAVLRAGPASYALTKRTIANLKKIDPDLAADLEYRFGSGYAGAFEMQRTHLSAKDLQGAGMDRVGRAIGTFARTPGPREFGHVWGTWTDAIFGSNGWIEHQIRLTAAGKYLKREGYGPHWFRDGGKAMQVAAEQAAKGMKGTSEQIHAARFVDRAMGQYSKWTSGRRFAVGVFTPFSAWAVNAVKFFVDVLPRDHPILTALLATSERATEEWRKQYGLGKFVDGAVPGWLQPSVVIDGKLHPVGRYTPAGAFADPLETAGRQVLPQWNSIFLNTLGLDWKGDPLNGKFNADQVSDGERAQAVLKSAASAFIPFFGLHQRIDEKGATALNPLRGYKPYRDTPETKKAREEKKKPNWVDELSGSKGPSGGGSWVDRYAK